MATIRKRGAKWQVQEFHASALERSHAHLAFAKMLMPGQDKWRFKPIGVSCEATLRP